MEQQNDFPYSFNSDSCKTCNGRCCRGFAGYILVEADELEVMAELKNMDVTHFSNQYVRQVQGRLSLLERVINGEHFCCFFEPIDCRCTIYQGRPKQCQTFPFWTKFKKEPQQLSIECPGVFFK